MEPFTNNNDDDAMNIDMLISDYITAIDCRVFDDRIIAGCVVVDKGCLGQQSLTDPETATIYRCDLGTDARGLSKPSVIFNVTLTKSSVAKSAV